MLTENGLTATMTSETRRYGSRRIIRESRYTRGRRRPESRTGWIRHVFAREGLGASQAPPLPAAVGAAVPAVRPRARRILVRAVAGPVSGRTSSRCTTRSRRTATPTPGRRGGLYNSASARRGSFPQGLLDDCADRREEADPGPRPGPWDLDLTRRGPCARGGCRWLRHGGGASTGRGDR